MGEKATRYRLTHRQAQLLFDISANFKLPKNLGEKTYKDGPRGLAIEDVQKVFRALIQETPDYDPSQLSLRVGKADNWEEKTYAAAGQNGTVGEKRGWFIKDHDKPMELALDEDGQMGVFWCLLLALHPASNQVYSVRTQVDVLWPLAKLMRHRKMLRKAIGTDKAEHSRLDLDPEEEDEKKDETTGGDQAAVPDPAKAKETVQS